MFPRLVRSSVLYQDAIQRISWETYLLCMCPIMLLIFARHYAKNRKNKSTPKAPLVPYLLPWVGSALHFGRDPDGFLANATSKFGPIFTVKVMGQKMTYVTSPDVISTVYRDAKSFEFSPFRLEVTHKVFGLSREATNSPLLSDYVWPANHRGLSPKNVSGLLRMYAGHALDEVKKCTEQYDGKITSLTSFLVLPAYNLMARTFFGRSFDAPRSYDPFRRFDDYFHLLLAGTPRFVLPGPHRAWEELVFMLEQYLENPHEDCCELFLDIESAARDAHWSVRDIAVTMGTSLWSFQANAIWAGYWTIAHALRNPQYFARLIAEVDLSRKHWRLDHPNETLDANIYDWLSSAKLPFLTSMIQESLRLSTSTFSIRRVTEPVILGGYQLETNERVICATRSVHLDESIHSRAKEFVADRYMDEQKKFMKNGAIVPNHSMPFGGGVSMCEGRHFVLGELKILVALVISFATVEVVDTGAGSPSKWPQYYKERIGAGVMPPVGDLQIRIRKRL